MVYMNSIDIINKRVKKDLSMLKDRQIKFQILNPNNIELEITGPKNTPYCNGLWKINLIYPNEYPFKSPSVGFINKIYHPNIDLKSGSVCLNVLNTSWSPIYTTLHIIDTFIPQLLTYPNPDDPLNVDAANLLLEGTDIFNQFVRKSVSFNKWNCV